MASFNSVGGVGSGGGGKAATDVLNRITYSEEKDRLIASVSMEFPPSTVYLGEDFSMSNAVTGIGFKLADGTDAIGVVNRFGENGSISNPKFFAIGARVPLNVNTISADTMTDPLEVSYTTSGDNLTYDFDIIPRAAGKLRAQYFIGNDDTGRQVFDYEVTVTEAMIDNVLRFGGNFYLLPGSTGLFVRFSGVAMAGDAVSGLPYFVSYIQPYREITLNNHTEFVTSDIDGLFIGCNYGVNTTAGAVTLTVNDASPFRDGFAVFDSAESFSVANPCIVDFSTFNYPAGFILNGVNVGFQSVGMATLQTSGDCIDFYFDDDRGVWVYLDSKTGIAEIV